MKYDLIAIGSGAAGLSAAVYAGRYQMKTLVIGKEFGGETARAGIIWNYPGYKQIDGYDLMKAMKEQAESLGAEVIDAEVTRVRKEADCFVVTANGKEYHATTIIYTMGSERKRLGLPKENELTSKGVHYCVTCDGPLYMGGDVAVVGGGDAAVKAVNFLASFANKIYLLVRGTAFRAEPLNVEEMKAHGDKVTILMETQVAEILGENKLEGIRITKPHNGSDTLSISGLFVEVGAQPNLFLTKEIGIEPDPLNYIKTDAMMKTNIPGAFAAGDITSLFGAFKQDITAAALGSVAATSAYEYWKRAKVVCSH